MSKIAKQIILTVAVMGFILICHCIMQLSTALPAAEAGVEPAAGTINVNAIFYTLDIIATIGWIVGTVLIWKNKTAPEFIASSAKK